MILRTFFPHPSSSAKKSLHSLDVKRCLKFYLQRTKSIRRTDPLLVSYGPVKLGSAVTKRTVARWIASTIHLCHLKAGKPLTTKTRAHYTRAMSSSAALFSGVPLDKICCAANWKNAPTFTWHYCLDMAPYSEAAVGQAVLRNLFQ